jgi:hypothetical protein
LLPAIEDEGLHSIPVTHLAQPSPNDREPLAQRASNERGVLDYTVRGRLLEFRTCTEGRGVAQNASLRHRTFADLVQLSLRHLRTSGPFFRSRPVFHLHRSQAHSRLLKHDRSAS